MLTPKKVAIPEDSMSAWSVIKYRKTSGHDDSQPFAAVICYEGKPVIEVSNDGWGGPNLYHELDKCGYPSNWKNWMEKFFHDAKEWGKENGCKFDFEQEDLWIEFYTQYRSFGITAKGYFAQGNMLIASGLAVQNG